jgi:hypothetical protein
MLSIKPILEEELVRLVKDAERSSTACCRRHDRRPARADGASRSRQASEAAGNHL